MRKMKLAMLIVFCVMLFGGTVVSFVLPDREFSDVENRELAKKCRNFIISATQFLFAVNQNSRQILQIRRRKLWERIY